MTKALVTGARGFIGGAAVEALRKRGARVVAAGRADADLLDAAAVRALVRRAAPDVIVHAAGATRGDWATLWDAHVRATLNLLDAVAALQRPERVRVVIAGSSAEYGAAPGRKPAREDGPLSPVGPYGSSKLSQRIAAFSYRRPALDVRLARIFNACGAAAPAHLVPGTFAKQLVEIERGQRPPVLEVGDLSPCRDFVDVHDIGRALAALAAPGLERGVYNVCSERSVPIRAVLDRLLQLSGAKAEVRPDPRRRRAADVPFIVGDAGKLRRAAGWEPRVSLDESLRDTLQAFRR